MQTVVAYLSQRGVRTWCLEGGTLAEREPTSRGRIVAVVDVPDESYVVTTLPAVRGRDAGLLKRRRLEREFPGARLKAAQVIRRRTDNGAVEAVLLAVNAGPRLEEDLTSLAAAHQLRAVTTPALLAGEWLRCAKVTKRHLLIVLQTPAGVRQMFFDETRPVLSRLTAPGTPAATATEIARTLQYLQNAQRIERADHVELWFWGIDDDVAAACIPSGVAVSPGAAPRVSGLPDPERDGFEALLRLAARGPGRMQLAPDELRIGWLADRIERSARFTAAATVLLAIGVVGALEWRTAGLKAAANEAIMRRQALASAISSAERQAHAAGVALAEIATLPAASDAISGGAPRFDDVLRVVGEGFGADPAIVVQRVDLRAAAAEGAGSELAGEAATPAADLAACAASDSTSSAVLEVEFTLAQGLDVRRRSAALDAVRTRTARLERWTASEDARTLGRRDSLVVSDEERAPLAADSGRWTVCLQRGTT